MSAVQTATATVRDQVTSTGTNLNVRVRKAHSVSEAFPECAGFAFEPAHRAVIDGFAEPGNAVPQRVQGFKHSETFVRKFASAIRSPRGFIINLFGPTGCGKSARVLDFCARLNKPILQISADPNMKIFHLVGSTEIVPSESGTGNRTVFMERVLLKAMKAGCLLLIDEGFKIPSTVTSRLHTVRDGGYLHVPELGQTVQAKPGFKIIVTSNQAGYGDKTGMHPGDSRQDAAWLNGAVRIKCDYPSPEDETAIVQSYLESINPAFGRSEQLKLWAGSMVKIANQAREVSLCNLDQVDNFAADKLEVAFSTRDLLNWCYYLNDLAGAPGDHPVYQALDMVMLDSASPSTRTTIEGWVLSELAIKRSDRG